MDVVLVWLAHACVLVFVRRLKSARALAVAAANVRRHINRAFECVFFFFFSVANLV